MSKTKFVPIEEEREFIQRESEIEQLRKQQDVLKTRFKRYLDKGYTFSLVTPSEPEDRFAPPWKDVATKLAESSGLDVPKWLTKLRKLYPPKPCAPSFRRSKAAKEAAGVEV